MIEVKQNPILPIRLYDEEKIKELGFDRWTEKDLLKEEQYLILEMMEASRNLSAVRSALGYVEESK
jgi:hypothetical protein|tara:strand:+ start:1859 stop:2056 length:198 start_codon:yes stop_codon:yes gene_type:complete